MIDTTAVFVAFAAAVPPTITLFAKWLYDARKGAEREAKVDAVHDEVRTNHGKRAGEYIEQLVEGQQIQSGLLLAHTRQDDTRFAELKTMLTAQNVATLAAAIAAKDSVPRTVDVNVHTPQDGEK